MADTDQKDKKKRAIKGTKIVEKEVIERNENQQFNFYIIRDMWKRFNPEPLAGLYKQLGISEPAYNKVIYESRYEDFNKERCQIKNEGLKAYLLGKKVIDIGIKLDDWKKHMEKTSKKENKKEGVEDKNKSTQTRYDDLAKILNDMYKNTYLPEIMKPKNNIERLCYFCKYGRECNEQDLELRVLEDAFNKVDLVSLYKCKDQRLLENILSISKEKLRDIETVYRCLELIDRIKMSDE